MRMEVGRKKITIITYISIFIDHLNIGIIGSDLIFDNYFIISSK